MQNKKTFCQFCCVRSSKSLKLIDLRECKVKGFLLDLAYLNAGRRAAAAPCCSSLLSAECCRCCRLARAAHALSDDQYRGRMEVTATPSRHGGGFDLRPDLALLDGKSGALQILMTNRPPFSRTDKLGLSGPFLLVSVLRLKDN